MDSKKSNKIADIVKLQRILKKWRRNTDSSKNNKSTRGGGSSSSNNNGNRSISFLKRTLSFNNNVALSGGSSDTVPKGHVAVCVGEEMKKFHIPMDYLGHQAFGFLLREAEEEFGFQQEGVLRIPCDVSMFESILKVIEKKQNVFFTQEYMFGGDDSLGYCSSESQHSQHHHPRSPLCR
uniref:Uncharacterized protein n=1 Tax=Kalanchoe fedtschenkoi TaxID=63787 RepID=A0A7N0ZYZ4_KALFE